MTGGDREVFHPYRQELTRGPNSGNFQESIFASKVFSFALGRARVPPESAQLASRFTDFFLDYGRIVIKNCQFSIDLRLYRVYFFGKRFHPERFL
jgi:hypothetical protein